MTQLLHLVNVMRYDLWKKTNWYWTKEPKSRDSTSRDLRQHINIYSRKRNVWSTPRNLTDFLRLHLNKARKPSMNDEQNIKRRWKLTLKDDVTVSKADLFGFSTTEVCDVYAYVVMLITAGLRKTRRRKMITWSTVPQDTQDLAISARNCVTSPLDRPKELANNKEYNAATG